MQDTLNESGYVSDVMRSVQTGVSLGRCPPQMEAFDPLRPERYQQPPIGGLSFQLPSRRKRDPHFRAALDASLDEVRHYRSVLQETAVQDALSTLPVKLDALWDAGIDLRGDALVEGATARRRKVLEYWATRDDSPTGVRMASAIEDWLAGTVVPSDAPITPSEYAEYEARRDDGRTLPRPRD